MSHLNAGQFQHDCDTMSHLHIVAKSSIPCREFFFSAAFFKLVFSKKSSFAMSLRKEAIAKRWQE